MGGATYTLTVLVTALAYEGVAGLCRVPVVGDCAHGMEYTCMDSTSGIIKNLAFASGWFAVVCVAYLYIK